MKGTRHLDKIMFSPADSNLFAITGFIDGPQLSHSPPIEVKIVYYYSWVYALSGTGTSNARFNGSGTRLLCNGQHQRQSQLAIYNLSATRQQQPFSSGKILINKANGFRNKGARWYDACCFAGIDDELVISAVEDHNLLI